MAMNSKDNSLSAKYAYCNTIWQNSEILKDCTFCNTEQNSEIKMKKFEKFNKGLHMITMNSKNN